MNLKQFIDMVLAMSEMPDRDLEFIRGYVYGRQQRDEDKSIDGEEAGE